MKSIIGWWQSIRGALPLYGRAALLPLGAGLAAILVLLLAVSLFAPAAALPWPTLTPTATRNATQAASTATPANQATAEAQAANGGLENTPDASQEVSSETAEVISGGDEGIPSYTTPTWYIRYYPTRTSNVPYYTATWWWYRTNTPTPSRTPTVSVTPTRTQTTTPSVTVTSTVTRTPTVTQTGTPTPTLARIVFSDQAANGLYNLFSMDINGGDVRLLATSAPAANIGLTAWDASPDGRWLVVELDGNPRQLALLRLDGSVPLKSLPAQPAADNDQAAWSPDSQWIVFHSAQDGSLYAIRSDGSDLRRLTNEAVDDTHPSWSPDGQNLIYAAGGDLWTLDTSGLYLPTLTATPNGAPPPAETDIPTPLPAPQKLSYSSSNAEDSPRYSPDGKAVLFARSVDGVWQLFRAVLWQVEALPGANAAGFNQQMPAWSSDGQYVVFVSDRSGTPQIYRIKSDGSGLAQLTAHAVNPIWPVWLP